MTSTVDMKDDSRGRPIQKAKVMILQCEYLWFMKQISDVKPCKTILCFSSSPSRDHNRFLLTLLCANACLCSFYSPLYYHTIFLCVSALVGVCQIWVLCYSM